MRPESDRADAIRFRTDMVKFPYRRTRRWTVVGLLWLIVGQMLGCHAYRNGWLDPTALGDFKYTATMDIRASLTIDDSPRGPAKK